MTYVSNASISTQKLLIESVLIAIKFLSYSAHLCLLSHLLKTFLCLLSLQVVELLPQHANLSGTRHSHGHPAICVPQGITSSMFAANL